MCVCVRERERERERGRGREIVCVRACERERLCVCVCVRERGCVCSITKMLTHSGIIFVCCSGYTQLYTIKGD